MYDYDVGDKVDINEVIWAENGTCDSAVYIGGLTNLRKVEPEWHEEFSREFGTVKYLTLREIAWMYKGEGIITVFVDKPLQSICYQFGNYGDYWVLHGKLRGYA